MGQIEVQLLSFNPEDLNPQWDNPISLGMRTYFPDYDHTSDPSRLFYYNLTTPYIDPYTNSIYLPNGGHSSISKVPYDPDESLLLNNGTWAWLSFPRLERDNGDPSVDEVLYGNGERIEPMPYLVDSKLRNIAIGTQNVISNIFTGLEWPSGGQLQTVDSRFGFKLNLLYSNPPDNKWLHLSGDVIDPDDAYINLAADPYENWLGYYLYEKQFFLDAFSEDDLQSIFAVQGQYWACGKFIGDGTPTPYWACACSKGSETLRYGDMAIIKTHQPINNFRWQLHGNSPTDISNKEETENYLFTEQSDYTPVFIELDTTENPLEVGAFVNDTCIGATTVLPGDSIIMVPAYTEGLSGEIYFESYFGSNKSLSPPVTEYYIRTKDSGKSRKSVIHTNNLDDYYMISFKANDDNMVSSEHDEAWIQCVPNPISNTGTLSLYCPHDTQIKISIFSIMGRPVAEVYNGRLSEGKHSYTISGNDHNGQALSNGTYIISVVGDQIMKQTKIVILR